MCAPPPPTFLPPDLMKRHPELMTPALHMHNSVLTMTKSDNHGYTVEQEGDRAGEGGGGARGAQAAW